MDDQTHVGLVDAHAKGVGGHHDAEVVIVPVALPLVFGGMLQPRMVVGGTDALLFEQLADFLRIAARPHIDDGTAWNRLQDVYQLCVFVAGTAHDVCQVLPLKAHLEHVLLNEPQPFLDVVHHLGRSRGGEGQHGDVGLQTANVGNMEVAGAEVVAPLADTVGLVHRDEAHAHTAQFLLEDVRR